MAYQLPRSFERLDLAINACCENESARKLLHDLALEVVREMTPNMKAGTDSIKRAQAEK